MSFIIRQNSRICHRSYQGSTTVGIRTPEGVVLAVEKRVQSPLLEASSIEKIMEIDTHLGCAMSGLTADARTMIDHARVTAQNHAFTYDERIKVESVTQAVCDLALRFGESVHDEEAMMSRPFGVALLIAGIDELGPQLYHTDPSGTFVRYDAKAIGSGSEAAQSELQDKWHKVIVKFISSYVSYVHPYSTANDAPRSPHTESARS
ncbi:proteasome component pup2 [Arthromyces matolae]|nr:proteasome component pup2 [Arthromyces matolae]